MSSRKKVIIQVLRAGLFFFTLFWIGLSFYPTKHVQENAPILLYSSECNDRLFTLFINAINHAKEDIHLIIYALSDQKIIHALNYAKKRGVHVKVIYDGKTDPRGFSLLDLSIEKEAIKSSALMHCKLLVIDKKEVYLGSANFTAESLRLHNNLVVSLLSETLASHILEEKKVPHHFSIVDQPLEFFTFPENHKEAIHRLLTLINEAQESLLIGMFTWTYEPLTDAIIEAHQRGVKVTAIIDSQSAYGASNKTLQKLLSKGIKVRIGPSYKLFHHKFLCVDKTTLVMGSANWTKSAFFRNRDCLLIINNLKTEQKRKINHIEKVIRCTTYISE